MNTQRVRLIMIVAIVLVLVGAIGYQAFRPEQAKAAAQSPVGSWIVIVSPDGQPSFTDVVIFSSDGTITVMESDGRLGLGVWQKLPHNQYAFSLWEYFVDNGTTLQVNVTSTIELSKDKEQYTGPYSVTVYVVGNPDPVGGGTGTATGVRQHIEP